MEAGATQLLEVLIAKHDSDRKSIKHIESGTEELLVPATPASFSDGSKDGTKKGILKKGLARRRASSLTSGETISSIQLALLRLSWNASTIGKNP